MKLVDNKVLLTELIDFIYHYPELDFWTCLEKFKERHNPQNKEEVILAPEIEIKDD